MEGGEHTLTTQNWKLVHSSKKKHGGDYLTSVPMTAVGASHPLGMVSMAAPGPFLTDTGCTPEKLH